MEEEEEEVNRKGIGRCEVVGRKAPDVDKMTVEVWWRLGGPPEKWMLCI